MAIASQYHYDGVKTAYYTIVTTPIARGDNSYPRTMVMDGRVHQQIVVVFSCNSTELLSHHSCENVYCPLDLFIFPSCFVSGLSET